MARPDAEGPVDAATLAALAGTAPELVIRLVEAGILGADGSGRFRRADITTVRYAEAFLTSGTPLSAIAQASRQGLMFFDTLELLYLPVSHTDETLTTLADRLGVTVETLEGVLTALGLPAPGRARSLRADDVRVLELLVTDWSTGRADRSGGWLTRAALGYGAVMRRLAELEHGLYMEAHAPEQGRVVADPADRRAVSVAAAALLASAQEVVSLLHARIMEQTIAETSVELTEAFLEKQGLLDRGHRRGWPAVAFVDVSGYTALSQQEGDDRAVMLASRFAELAQLGVHAAGGRLVKLLGDGALLLFRDVDTAIAATFELYTGARDAGLPGLHAGIHAGPVIERDGDVFGRTVNLAARISARAGTGEVLVSRETAEELDPTRWTTALIGEVELKGVGGPVPLHRVTPRPAAVPAREAPVPRGRGG